MGTQTFDTTGTLVVPAGVTSMAVQCWGAGASSTGNTGTRGDDGGGGGAYAENLALAVTPGNTLNATVDPGNGGSFTAVADSGAPTTYLVKAISATTSSTTAGTAAASTGVTTNGGGTGGTHPTATTNGGGGGGSGGPSGAGGNASGITGGAAGSGGGAAGPNGGTGTNSVGTNGNAPGSGAGGAGAKTGGGNHGTGAAGRVILTWNDAVAKSSSESGTGTDAQSLTPAVAGAETGTGTDAGSISATPSSSDSGTGTDISAPYSPTALPWAKYRPSFYGWLAGTGKDCTVAFGPGDSISALFNAQDGGTSARYVDGYVAYVANLLQAMRQSGGSAKPAIYVPGAMPKSLGVEVWPEGTNPWTNVGAAGVNQDGLGGLMEIGYKMNNGGRQITVPSGYTHVIVHYARLSGNNTLVIKYDGTTVFTDSPTTGTEPRTVEIALGSDNKVLDIQNTSLTNMSLTGVIFEDRSGSNGTLRMLTAGHGGWGADTWAHPVASPVGVQSGDTANLWAQRMAQLDVDLAVIFLGVNDARHDSSGMPGVDDSATFGTDLTAIVTTLDAAFATAGKVVPDLLFVCYCYIDLTVGDSSHAYNSTVWSAYVSAMQTSAAAYGTRAQFLDLGTKFGPLTGTSPETSSVDNIHPNALGHSKIATAIFPYLAQLPIVTSSDSGTGTDAATTIKTSSSESGVGTETGVLAAPISSSDSGTGTDAVSLIALSAADSGAGTETAAIAAQTAATDAATGSDSATVAPAVTSADSGAGTDAATLLPAVQSTETGTATETGSIAVAFTSSETAAGTDTATVAAAVSSAETATGIDTPIVLAIPTSAETGTGTDAGALISPVTSSETGALTDTGTLLAQPASAETGTLTDTGVAGIAVTSSEAGVGTEASAMSVAVADTQTGALTDAGLIAAVVSSAELAVGVDAGTFLVHITSAEFAVGSELSTAITVAISSSETAVGSMNGLLLVLQTLIVIRRRYELRAVTRRRPVALTHRTLTAHTIHRP